MRTLASWALLIASALFGHSVGAVDDPSRTKGSPPPAHRVLFVVLNGSYNGDGANAFNTLAAAAGAGNATAITLSSNGQLANALTNGSYDQIWIYDLSTGSDNYPADYDALATWYASHPSKHVIADARFVASYWNGRSSTEGARLTQNYFHNLRVRGGGLVLASDHDAFFVNGINGIALRIGLNPFVGNFSLTTVPVDTAHPVMATPNVLGPQVWADSSPGQTPFGLQPNGLQMYGIAWNSGNPATPAISTTIFRAEQSALSVAVDPASLVFGGSGTLSTSGGSGTGAVSYAVTAGQAFCSVAGTTLTGLGAGSCTVTATKAADANFEVASASVEVTVTRAQQSPLEASAMPSIIALDETSALSANGGSGTGVVSYAVTMGESICSVTGDTLTGIGVGTCTVTATKAADANHEAASATVEVTVTRKQQSALSASASPTSIVFGATSTLSTSGGSGTGAVSYVVTSGATFCAVADDVLSGIGVGGCTVTATKAADAVYEAATATVDVSVTRAPQSVLEVAAAPASIAFGDTSSLSTSGGSGTGAVSYTITAGATFCSVATDELNGIGVGTCTVTATKAADAVYEAATATVDVSVTRAPQSVLEVAASPASIAFGATSSLSTSGGSGTGAVSYTITAGATFCSVATDELNGIGVGTCTVTATKAADANYEAASADVAITVQAAADLRISNDDGASQTTSGAFVEYEILVTNAGPLGVAGARVQNTLPVGLTDPLWSCTPIAAASCPDDADSGAIDQRIDLPANAGLRYRFSANVTAAPGSTITHTATVTAPLDTVELDAGDNSASDANAVVPPSVFADGFEIRDPE